MSYTELKIEQGTEEWLRARAGLITASRVNELVKVVKPRKTKADPEPVPYLALADGDTALSLIEELAVQAVTGIVETVPETWAMRRGTELEPHARFDYEMNTGHTVVETGLLIREDKPGERIGYSPDGLVGDEGLLEIKCMNARRHNKVHLTQSPMPEHVAQLQTGLYVTGRAWIDYVAFRPEYPTAIVRVTPDPQWQSIIALVAEVCNEQINTTAELYANNTAGLPVAPHIELDF